MLSVSKVFASAGYENAVILQDGSVRSWTLSGQTLGTPVAGNDFVGIHLVSRPDLFRNIAIRSNGTLATWGSAPPYPFSFVDIVAIAGSDYYILGLKSDGTVVDWSYGGATGFAPAGLVAQSIAVGYSEGLSGAPFHAIAVKPDGTVVVWGRWPGYDNVYGQQNVPFALQNPATANIDSVAAFNSTCVALRNGETPIVWGHYGIVSEAVEKVEARGTTAYGKRANGTWAVLAGTSTLYAGKVFSDLSVGAGNVLGLDSGGRVRGWSSGCLPVPSALCSAPELGALQEWFGMTGIAFSATPTLYAGSIVTGWSATGLPSWASINSSTGEITGTPAIAGHTTVSVSVSDGAASDTKDITISIELVPIVSAEQSFTGKVGVAFSESVAISNGATVTSWEATSLPSGLSISAGLVTGTPTTLGSFTANIRASGASGHGPWVSVGFTISAGTPIITGGQIFTGNQDIAFSHTPALTGGSNRPVTGWSATGLPAWAEINSVTGAITGTPDQIGSATLSVTATGPGGADTMSIAISISEGPSLPWREGLYASNAGIACPLVIWGYPFPLGGGVIPEFRPVFVGDLEPEDLAASDWVVNGSVPASGAALATDKVIHHRLDNGVYLANWPYGGDAIVNLLRVEMPGNGAAFHGEFLVHPKFSGNLEVVLDTFIQGAQDPASAVNLGVKFFPYVTDAGVSIYRSGTASDWDYEISGGDEGYGLWPALGSFGIFRLTKAIPDDMGSVIAALRMRLVY